MEGLVVGDLLGVGFGGGFGWGLGVGEEAEGDEDENMVYYFLEESTGYMEFVLRCLSLLYTLVAFFCIIGYNCFKVGYGYGFGVGVFWGGGGRYWLRGFSGLYSGWDRIRVRVGVRGIGFGFLVRMIFELGIDVGYSLGVGFCDCVNFWIKR